MVNKAAQMHISFGMIFSIILIIFFLAFAFYGIRAFMGVQDSAKTAKLIGDLRADVSKVWKSAQSSQKFSYTVPAGVTSICFADFSDGASRSGKNQSVYSELKKTYFGTENMVFYPVKSSEMESALIEHINIEKTTSENNPFCIPVKDGKIELRLVKDISDSLVTVRNA